MATRARRGKLLVDGASLRDLRVKLDITQEAFAADVTSWASSIGRPIEITQSKMSDIENNVPSERKVIDPVADYVFDRYKLDIRLPNSKNEGSLGVGGPAEQQTSGVRFFNSFSERDPATHSVEALIVKAKRRIIISGIALFYLPKWRQKQVLDAAERGVRVALIVAKKTPATQSLYAPYVSDKVSFAARGYAYLKPFRSLLSKKAMRNLGCYTTSYLITHSIGVYDQSIYISELCLVDDKGLNPSYAVEPGSSLHPQFEREAYRFLASAKPLFGSPLVERLFPEAKSRKK